MPPTSSQLKRLVAVIALLLFLLGSFFGHGDGGDTLLPNVF
jgi:hypothetical protein